MTVKSVVVMAGGTGGHVFPALAVAQHLAQQGIAIHWLGTANGIEADIVPKNGFPISYLDVKGVRGQGIARLLLAPFKILAAILAAMRVLKAVKADCVIGLGGYVTGPGGVAARLLAKPLIIHEQNAIAGFTNKQLSHLATTVLQAFPQAFAASPKVKTTGNPVRPVIAQLASPEQRYAEREGALNILILGGSQGAVALNDLVPQALALLTKDYALTIRHQSGKNRAEATLARYQGLAVTADVQPFIADMAEAYAWADLVICRSGALTVSEIAAAGVASVLVPYPFAVDDHQTANGRYLSDAGAALLCPQQSLTPESLADRLKPLLSRATLLQMAVIARKLAQPEATATVANYCLRAE
ncbi:undecaprenyldiphospho-muramoylpentapeptide beta-N-acetylglucosaminyltransferase [Agitococcus lubricus]|uniref:UDP-N-acetylglucosamine--N-acetylmuramyl-(pentapeptide) pyrophosphoryl-undecaprenol N-acetylglucosamine transferase n=1 Tax=Agitococcus lubricus TaxID=1077255 RepID=A0A2T5J0K4_9GAMM|nr:undecaprenyldiphospho-muramoylpentapeptide beta-N-acetylglucosaminyltransferase [Agitococcus lubricus]PTQ89872.1 UDP-N-acetylglucosamine-N-acetylmuramylpentapeptide N-acetylglucosamine transferase [Agitococcus lubricus]